MNIVFSVIILLVTISASLISLNSYYWFVPLIFVPISIIGYLKRKALAMESGIMLSIFSYLILNMGADFNPLNLLSLIGILFMFMGVWFFGKQLMLLDMIEENTREGPNEGYVNRLERSTSYKILGNVLLGAVLSILASIMGMVGFLGLDTSGLFETVLMLVFTFALFFIIYLMLHIISSEEK